MKQKRLLLTVFVAALSTFAVSSASAITESQTAALQKAVAAVRAPELPATAVKLVTEASDADRESLAVATIEAILNKNPGSAISVVGAISKAAPEVSAAVAAKAALMLPSKAAAIAKAAAASAPKQAAKIAAAVAATSPKQSIRIAGAVMDVVPLAAQRIATSVTAAVPGTSTRQMARITERAADHGGGQGTVEITPGTLSGETPNEPPADATAYASPGEDPLRGQQ